jgi:hypothetical protein
MKILSLDPGGTTGWALYNSEVPELESMFKCGQIGPEQHHEALWSLLVARTVDLIVCESFQYRNGLDKAELISCEYIGIVMLFKAKHPHIRVVFQTAAQGKVTKTSFVKERHLEKLGLYVPRMKHAMDGYGHLLFYAINGGNPDLAELRMKALEIGWKNDDRIKRSQV